MGCFSVTCVLSGISIYRQDAVYIPLQPVEYTKLNEKGQVPFEVTDNYVSNDGAFGMFVPKYLPVFGSYNTYGRLEAIEESDIFNVCKEYINNMYSEYESQYGCFVDREMWDWAVKKSREEINVYNNYAVGKYIELYADELGFVYEGNNSEEIYNRVFHHVSNPNHKFYTDGTWLKGSIYDFDSLIRYGKKNKCTITNTKFLKTVSPIETDLIDDMETRRRSTINTRYYSDLSLSPTFRDINHLYDLYESIPVDIFAKELANLMHFAYTMFLCNRMFIPQMSGTQTGEYSVQKQMYAKAIEVCNGILNRYK